MAQPRHLVIYDGDCPMCSAQMRLLRRLDWFHRLRMLPLADPAVREAAPSLSHETLLEAIHCVTPSGRVYRGARCLRFVGMRTPLLLPLALLLWLPGMIWVADKIYQRVSRNRYLLSRLFGCQGSCAIPHGAKPEKLNA